MAVRLVVSITAFIMLRTRIVSPILAITAAMKELAAGTLSTAPPPAQLRLLLDTAHAGQPLHLYLPP